MDEVAPLVHPEREAADEVGERAQDALGAALGDVDVGLDRVRAPVDARDHRGRDVLDVAGELEPGGRGHRAAGSPKKTAMPPSSGSARLRSASCQKSSRSSASFSGCSAARSWACEKSSGR